jgi:hypothetical protein
MSYTCTVVVTKYVHRMLVLDMTVVVGPNTCVSPGFDNGGGDFRAQVLVLDFDVHHGNGTNDIFYDDPSVLFISSHQNGIYPQTGRITDAGSGDAEGATINLPLPGTVLIVFIEERNDYFVCTDDGYYMCLHILPKNLFLGLKIMSPGNGYAERSFDGGVRGKNITVFMP